MIQAPKLSVVMPVRNALPYLDNAIKSIVGQTFGDFEFVIRDDHSTDGSIEVIRAWAARDKRIRLHEGKERKGPAGSSNWVVGRSGAPVVARMDADDIAHPDRLRRQLMLLDAETDAVLVGSVWEGIDRAGRIVREADLSTLNRSNFSAPFAHGSIMFRRAAFDAAGGYREQCNFWEDLDLYLRMAMHGRVLVIPEPLYQHRFSETSTRLVSERIEVERSVDLMFRCREAHLRGEDYTPLLSQSVEQQETRKLDPNAFLSLGFISLWSGIRPHLLSGMLQRADIKFDAATAKAIVWAIWADLSPYSLRWLMRLLLHRRSARARQALGEVEYCEWHPGTQWRSSCSS